MNVRLASRGRSTRLRLPDYPRSDGVYVVSQSGTLALAAAIGAAARLVIRGVWTWKAVATGAASVVVAFALASLTVHYLDLSTAPPEVVHGVYTLFGVVVLQILERLEHIKFTAKIGGIEVSSEDKEP